MKIKAAVLYETNTPFQVETIDLEPPRAGEVLVKIAAAGICHSDYHVATGHTERPTPIVLGHEGAGMVTAVGENVTHVKVGDHVLLSWLPNCGTCFYCLNNRPNLCQAYLGPIWNGTMTDGTLRLSKNPIYHLNFLSCWAEYAVVQLGINNPRPAPKSGLKVCHSSETSNLLSSGPEIRSFRRMIPTRRVQSRANLRRPKRVTGKFSRGVLLASASDDKSIKLWDMPK